MKMFGNFNVLIKDFVKNVLQGNRVDLGVNSNTGLYWYRCEEVKEIKSILESDDRYFVFGYIGNNGFTVINTYKKEEYEIILEDFSKAIKSTVDIAIIQDDTPIFLDIEDKTKRGAL